MRAPAFWWNTTPTGMARLLSPLGALYGAISASRMVRVGARATVPVICIGNPTVGGAGKTPTALFVAERLKSMGRKPVFLTRGYGGTLKGPILVDLSRHSALDCGDEPLLLARSGPTVVAANRVLGSRLAALHGDVIVMDDGFQNPSLAKDYTIAVLDGAVGVGNGLCLPAGPLRAPLSVQWPRVDIIVVIGARSAGLNAAHASGRPVVSGVLMPDQDIAAMLKDQRIMGFAGIGRPEKFFATLESLGARLVMRRSFADHHPYRREDIASLIAEADLNKAILATTEKDMVRIASAAPDLVNKIVAVPVTLALEHDTALDAMLEQTLTRWTHPS